MSIQRLKKMLDNAGVEYDEAISYKDIEKIISKINKGKKKSEYILLCMVMRYQFLIR